ncbi:MAG TPA: antitermination protein NusG, partial [Candidatus Marinimicrobia bacterium]|nr:antitermination protein NusG [Candidatus Neomarinimicrobiota bacterium]
MRRIHVELIHPIFKWLHIIAGITWIGLLYFFNFINGHVAATMDADTKKKVM